MRCQPSRLFPNSWSLCCLCNYLEMRFKLDGRLNLQSRLLNQARVNGAFYFLLSKIYLALPFDGALNMKPVLTAFFITLNHIASALFAHRAREGFFWRVLSFTEPHNR